MDLPSGSPIWLGATPVPEHGGTNFAIQTPADVTRVELCLFDQVKGAHESQHLDLTARQEVRDSGGHLTGYIWHGLAKGVTEGQLYGFRLHGPRHNPNKLILDPESKAQEGEVDAKDARNAHTNNDNNGDITAKSKVVDWRALPAGNTEWLGATPEPEKGGTNFCFYTGKDATAVELCLFAKAYGANETQHLCLRAKEPVMSDDGKHLLGYLWHGFAQGVQEGQMYGFRVHGPYDPSRRLFFNPAKLLLDPCAKAVTGEIHQWEPRNFPQNWEDNGPIMPKARVVDWKAMHKAAADLQVGALYPHADSNILKLHVQGASVDHPQIPKDERGTYKGLTHPDFVNFVKDWEYTTLELMPVESFGTDSPLAGRGKKNYWGYMTMAAMAPHTGYAATSHPEKEIADTIRTLKKDHNLEIILDIVPNHSLESGHGGPVVNLRGMDDFLYLQNDYTGTGNTRDFGHPINRRMLLEELKHWQGLGIAGFRIDLATVLGRVHGSDFDPNSPMIKALRQEYGQDSGLRNLKFYGEPWDLGPNGVQRGRLAFHNIDSVGLFSEHIAEWDGLYRDTMQKLLNPEAEVTRGELIRRISGSSDFYSEPQDHVIKIGSHDGGTLKDMVSRKHKNNFDNGEDNRDGNHLFANWGAEGDTDDPTINANRLRAQRFAIALQSLSLGVPMTTLGHERGKSQNGNTNAYCQGNKMTAIPWGNDITAEGHAVLEFTKMCNKFRKKHFSLRRATHFTGQPDEASGLTFDGAAMKDVTWLSAMGKELDAGAMDWPGGFGMMLSGDPGNSPAGVQNFTRLIRREGRDDPLLILVNPSMHDWHFTLPDVPGVKWKSALNSLDPANINWIPEDGKQVTVGYRSVVVFEGQRELLQGVAQRAASGAGMSM